MLVSQASRMQVFHTFTGSTSSATYGPFEVQGAGEISIMAIHNPPTAAGTVQWQQLFLRGGNDTVFSNATNLVGFSGVTATTSVTTSSFNLAVYSGATPVAPITLLTVKNPRFSHLFIQAQDNAGTCTLISRQWWLSISCKI